MDWKPNLLDRPRQAEHINMGCAMVHQQARTFIYGCPGGINIINQQYAFIDNLSLV